jgi:HSP20 family molecular chaperone IbpA
MTKLRVQKVRDIDDRRLPIFSELDDCMDRVRKRAFELFADRDFRHGHEIDDWLTAERQICWPAAELSEKDKELVAKVALPGFDADEITLTINPEEMIVKAVRTSEEESEPAEKVHWSEFRSRDVYRRIGLPCHIDVDHVSANFDGGLLKVKAAKDEKQEQAGKEIKISSVA